MSRLSSVLVVIALLCASMSLSNKALACKCMIAEPPAAREDASAVFEGRVVSITEHKGEGALDRHQVKLSVVRTWKGLEQREQVDVFTNGSSAACGYTFAKDATYLVYANEHEGELSVSGCSRTRPLADAADDLAFLGAGSTPVAIAPSDKSNAAGSSTPPVHDAGAPPAANAPKPVQTRSGGCASGRSASASWLLALPVVGIMLRRRRRSS
jgi:hypothetical protein